MIAKAALIFKTVIGSEGTHAPPCFIFGQQKIRSEYSDIFRDDMHGRLLRDEVPVYDYLIELAPFALVFVTSRELCYMGISE